MQALLQAALQAVLQAMGLTCCCRSAFAKTFGDFMIALAELSAKWRPHTQLRICPMNSTTSSSLALGWLVRKMASVLLRNSRFVLSWPAAWSDTALPYALYKSASSVISASEHSTPSVVSSAAKPFIDVQMDWCFRSRAATSVSARPSTNCSSPRCICRGLSPGPSRPGSCTPMPYAWLAWCE